MAKTKTKNSVTTENTEIKDNPYNLPKNFKADEVLKNIPTEEDLAIASGVREDEEIMPTPENIFQESGVPQDNQSPESLMNFNYQQKVFSFRDIYNEGVMDGAREGYINGVIKSAELVNQILFNAQKEERDGGNELRAKLLEDVGLLIRQGLLGE